MKILHFAMLFCLAFLTSVGGQQKAPAAFSLKNIDGKLVSLNNFKAEKGIILTFVTNNCPVAEMYQQRIEALHNKFAKKGFPVVAINQVDDFEEMKKITEARKYSYQFLYDSTQTIALSYNVRVNTHTFILLNTPTGFKIVYNGAIDDDYSGDNVARKYVENVLNALLNKKSIALKRSKALGCPIEYRN